MKSKIHHILAITLLIPTLTICSQRSNSHRKNPKKSQTNSQNSKGEITTLTTNSESTPLNQSSDAIMQPNNPQLDSSTPKKLNLNEMYESKTISIFMSSLEKVLKKLTKIETGVFVPYEITQHNKLDELEEKRWPSQYRAAKTNIPLASSLTCYRYGDRYEQEHNIITNLLNNYQNNNDPEIIEWNLQKHAGTQRKINYFIAESINQSTIQLHDTIEENQEEVVIEIKTFENALNIIKQSLQYDEEKDKHPITLWTQPDQKDHENLGRLLQEKRLALYEVIVEHLTRYMDHVQDSLKNNAIETIATYSFPKNIKIFAKKLYDIALKINCIHNDKELDYTILSTHSKDVGLQLSQWILISQAYLELKENDKILKQVFELNNKRITFNQKIEDLKNEQTSMLAMSIMPEKINIQANEITNEANTPENKETEEKTLQSGFSSFIPFY